MFSRLFHWLSVKPAAKGDAIAFADGLHWIKAGDNPWRVDILDCRPVAFRWTSTTSDPAIADSFVRLRSSDGRQHAGAEPLPHRVNGYLTLDISAQAPEGALFRSSRMEEKWDIYHFDGRLYAARSWTGELVYTAALRCDGEITTVDDIRTTKPDPGYARRELHFLLAGVCQLCPMPSPLPVPDIPDSENRGEKALAGHHLFATFGCQGWFATVADLTEFPPIPIEELKQWLDAHPPSTTA